MKWTTSAKDQDRITCPDCKGEGVSFCHQNRGADSTTHRWGYIDCMTCGGEKTITRDHLDRIREGRRLMAQRQCNGESLMDAARRQGMTPTQLSAIEHGRIPK